MSTPLYPSAVRGATWPTLKSHEFATIVQKAPNLYTTRIVNSQNPIWHWSQQYEYLKDNPADLVASLAPYTDYRYLEGFLLGLQGQSGEFLYDDLTDDAFGMRSQPGGLIATPSSFKVTIYPTQEFFYPLNSYVVDNNATPHLQLVVQGGVSAGTVPGFSTSGGTVTSGTAKFQDQGVFNGANAQAVPLVQDTSTSIWYSPIQRNFGGQFLEDVTDLNTTVYALKVWDNAVLKAGGGTDYTLLGPGLAIPGYSYEGMYLKWVGTPVGPITILGQFYFRNCMESDQQDIEKFLRDLWTIGGTSGKNGSGELRFKSSRVALV